jgi:hypothetical protein
VSWVLIHVVIQPSPARPVRPWRPCPPPAPPPPDLFGSFDFSRTVTSLSFFHLSLSLPRGALGFGVEIAGIWILGGEFSPPLPSPSLSPSPPLLLPCVPSPVPVVRAPGGPRCHTRILGVQNPGANINTRYAGTKSHTYDV